MSGLPTRGSPPSFGFLPGSLLVPVGDPSPIQVVRGQLDLHAIARQDADVVPAHLARDVPEDLVVVVELDAEHRVGEGLEDLALHLDLLLFCQGAFLRFEPAQESPGTGVPRRNATSRTPGGRARARPPRRAWSPRPVSYTHLTLPTIYSV